ncbi:MAG: VWA domain-containing protein [Thermicanus sp.]|nr:VWA domain-containing protein [Thermicanus sp.]
MNRIVSSFLVISVFWVLFLSGCSDQAIDPNDPNALRIIGGSELKDLKDTGLLDYIQQKSGVKIQLDESGSLAAVEKIAGEEVMYDGIWIPNGFYLEAFRDQIKHPPIASEKIFMSPVVLGIQRSLAQQYGWIGPDGFSKEEITWNDIREKVVSNQLQFYMTNMNSSNSGALGVVGMMNGFLEKADPLTMEDLKDENLIRSMKEFFQKGIKKSSGSSGWLADIFLKEGGDAIVNYESVIAELNKKGADLVIVYPKEGIAMADYPFYLLNEKKKEAYDRVLSVLKSQEFQRLAMEKTNRRPLYGNIPLRLTGGIDANRVLYSLPLPEEGKVLQEMIRLYLDEVKKPSQILFVLDMSGSMSGDRIERLRKSLLNLTGTDLSFSGQLARFTRQDHVTYILFNDRVSPPRSFEVTGKGDLEAMQQFIQHEIESGGGTAIYSALSEALKQVLPGDERYPTIVLLTDGENNRGISFDEFAKEYETYTQKTGKRIPIYPILFGEGNVEEMKKLAEMSHGRTFDAIHEPLETIFKDVRGYN